MTKSGFWFCVYFVLWYFVIQMHLCFIMFDSVFQRVKGSMSKVAKSFICRGCLNPVTSAGRTSVDIGAR